ncbi:TolC family protein [Rubripirellula reticaptiva]|uniref:Outer membrane efflux protein n=1 Tax=Rubripirellula reticaptiva TaxID=2528013 RepID=A0A5C6FCN4_9BACT|nr:TolC family protein [Rubripirellula reticaptiva]TWU58064.1 Outer membrane efflux protein [Rubripirellula reticaptiva]
MLPSKKPAASVSASTNFRRACVVACAVVSTVGCSASRFAKPDSSVKPDTLVESPILDSQQRLLDQAESIFQLVSVSEQRVTQYDESEHDSHLGLVADESVAVGEVSYSPDPVAESAQPRDANVVPDQFYDLTESQMLSLALANSPVLRPLGIRVLDSPAAATTVYDTAIAATDPFYGPAAALAEFDTRLTASLSSQNNDRVFNNSTLGGDVQQLVQDFASLNTGLQKRSLSGAAFNFDTVHAYDNNNRSGNSFRSYWENQYQFGVRQPILQGAGREFNLIAGPNAQPGFNFSNGILIARLNNRMSDADFAISLRTFVRDLYSVYWDLKRQYENYQNVLVAEELACRTWQSVLAKSDASVTGGEANKEAQARAKYYSYKRQTQTSLGGDGSQEGLYVVERKLRRLIGLPIVDGELLRPVDAVPCAPMKFDYDALITRAMASRTELTRQSMKVQQQQLRLIAAKNFLLPQLDLIGRYRLRGFGDDLTGDDSGERFASAYKDFFSLDHQEFEFGVEMGVTAGRRQARAAVRNAGLQVNREQSVLAEQQRTVEHQISDAHAAVASAYAAMETSLAQVDASRTRLESSQALFVADKIQIEFMLDAQEELLRAETQLAADQTRYAMSLVEVNAATGTLLSDLGIHVQHTACQSHAVFAY